MSIRTFPSLLSYENTWEPLKEDLVNILKKIPTVNTMEELYKQAYILVLHKHGDKLYDDVKEILSAHSETVILPQIIASVDTNNFSSILCEQWNHFCNSLLMIRCACMYLDRVFIQQQRRGLLDIYNLGCQIFRDKIVKVETISEKLRQTLNEMDSMNENEWTNTKFISDVLIKINGTDRKLYENMFEEQFLKNLTAYYRTLRKEFSSENKDQTFAEKTTTFIESEKQRADKYLDEITKEKLLKILNQEFFIVGMENTE